MHESFYVSGPGTFAELYAIESAKPCRYFELHAGWFMRVSGPRDATLSI